MPLFRNVVFLGLALFASPAHAQEIIEEYRAYISQQDLYNSSGDRLTKPWEIIRQDRANYHRFGRADPDDYYDSFFASEQNRAIAENIIRKGRIEDSAGRSLVDGNVFVRVQIYGRGNRGDSVRIFVEQGEPSNSLSLAEASRNGQTPVLFGDPDFEFGCSGGEIVGLDPYGDGYVSVRKGPSSGNVELDRLYNGRQVYICDTAGDWSGIVYPKKGQTVEDCGLDTGGSTRQPYTGPCSFGWLFSRYVKGTSG